MKHTLIAVLVLASLSCSRMPSSQHLPDREKFTGAYVALLKAGVTMSDSTADSLRSRNAAAVLAARGITVEEFRATVRQYHRDLKQWNDFYEGVVRNLEQEEKAKTPQ